MVQLTKKILKQTARHMQVMAKNDDLFFEGNKTVFRSRGHLGIFWVGMCRPGLKIGTPF